MTLSNVTFLFVAVIANEVFAGPHLPGINEANIPMVPPPYQMAEVPKQNQSDRQLSLKVQQQLKANLQNYNPENNMIVSQKGEVILQGKVSSTEEEKKILEVIKKVKGVSKIKNKMVVLNQPQTK